MIVYTYTNMKDSAFVNLLKEQNLSREFCKSGRNTLYERQ